MNNERLSQLRTEIDAIDTELAVLFERRMNIVSEVAIIKHNAELPIYDSSREDIVISQGRERVSPEHADNMEQFLRELMRLSKEYQKKVVVRNR